MHYLQGIVHTGSLNGKPVLSTWTTTNAQAREEKQNFLFIGAKRALVLRDGKIGFKIVGYF